ncbi:hypothetical protein RRG08_024375 [Elysia crispata]|uniref:Uncharacterized protein n=1 Tax=Elysia crispata TaxID=231223 RepID=A0AAE1DJ46_9GAST|nr:hypothetical protein RRG08_024375 [Elysia crispata]
MRFHLVLAIVIFIPTIASAFLLFDGDPKWDGLKVTWGPNPLSSSYFVSQPRTAADAVNQGFQKISDCDVNAKWRGARYVKGGDYSLILLYDVNGYIAGIQTSSIGKYPKQQLQPPYVDDGDRWVVSAYFTDPSKICTTGRTADEFNMAQAPIYTCKTAQSPKTASWCLTRRMD